MRPPEVASFSLIGGREVNEDMVMTARSGNRVIGIVADGLGGYGGGEMASQAAAAALMETLQSASRLDAGVIGRALARANAAVLACQAEHSGGMMSTIALAAVEGHWLWTAHVGDTRIYRFQKSQMKSCTHDDSVTQLMADRGEITREEMRHHETRNLLTRCLGRMEPPEGRIKRSFWWGGTSVLLCSDGFWENFSDAELAAEMTGETPERILEGLREKVQERMDPESDNCTALLIG